MEDGWKESDNAGVRRRDEDTRLGVSFDMQGGLFLCACGGTGGDARVGRRAVSSDTAM